MEPIPQMTPWFGQEEADACYEYMMSGGYVTEYKQTRALEEAICNYTGAKYCHMVNNGTISLSLALLAVGVGPGDEVLVPNFTMIASANAITLINAKPIFLDVGKELVIDVKTVKKNITSKTKAVMHVSLNNRTDDLVELRSLCDERGIYLIEDSAQSLGSFVNGKHIGTFGHIGSFSFSTPKIISTGQGGALITDDPDLDSKIRRLKDFGRECGGSDVYVSFGINSKFTDLQAVVGLEQMKKLPSRVERMHQIWRRYYDNLQGIQKIEMFDTHNKEVGGWIPWFIDIYVPDPDDLKNYLKEKQIGTRRVYPPLNKQAVYPEWNDITFGRTENYSSRGLWLPSSTKLTDEQIDYICQSIKEYFS